MARERREATTSFVPAAKYSDLVEYVEKSQEPQHLPSGFVRTWLKNVFERTQRQNDNWAEARFQQIRGDRNDWSYDGMWVDEGGEVAGNALWSTYKTFLYNANSLFDMHNLVSSIVNKKRMLYPLSPKYEAVIFWKEADEEKALEAVGSKTSDFQVEDYFAVLGAGRKIRMARVRRDKVGPAALASVGITMGNIGFWENRHLAMGQLGHGIYVPRVAFRDTALLPKGAYITPLDADEVKARGGRLMEEKYPDVPIIRVGKEDAQADFIAAALSAQRPNKDCPVVLSYTTSRLWLGEGPKHGLGRSGSESQISHL